MSSTEGNLQVSGEYERRAMLPIQSAAEIESSSTKSRRSRAEQEKGDVARRGGGRSNLGSNSAKEGIEKQAKSRHESNPAKQGSKQTEARAKQGNVKDGSRDVKGNCDQSDTRKMDASRLQILVKEAGNEKALSIIVARDTKVRELKKAIAEQRSRVSESAESRLIFGGKILEDDLNISEYGICNKCTIHLILPTAGVEESELKIGALTRSLSQQSMSTKAEPCVKRSSSLHSLGHTEAEDEAPIPCEALRYVDNKWYRASRSSKTAKGYLVLFPQFRMEGVQETSSEHIKLRPWWWRSLREEDVISLEPLNRLKYEPFELPSSDEKTHWFDGKVLANYLISSANFVHPVSRRPLERSEMLRLDEYISKHSLGKAMVVHVFDRKDDSSENATNHVSALRREATELLGALFASRNPAAPVRGRMNEGRDQRDRGQRSQTQPDTQVAEQGSMRGGRRAEIRNRSLDTGVEQESLMITITRLRSAAESTVEETAVSERNQALVRKMKICLSSADQRRSALGSSGGGRDPSESSMVMFDQLRAISGEFRSGFLGGEQYALQLFDIFGYKIASAAERKAVDDVLVELLALLPDEIRRKELSAALVNCLERLAVEARHILQVSDTPSGARRAREQSSNQGREAAAAAAFGATPLESMEAVLEPQAFPSLDGSDRSSAGGVFGGAWLSRPRRADLEQAAGGGGSGARAADAEEAFPVLRETVRDAAAAAAAAQGPLGVCGGDAGGRTLAGAAEPREAAPATRKTKRGTLLLF